MSEPNLGPIYVVEIVVTTKGGAGEAWNHFATKMSFVRLTKEMRVPTTNYGATHWRTFSEYP